MLKFVKVKKETKTKINKSKELQRILYKILILYKLGIDGENKNGFMKTNIYIYIVLFRSNKPYKLPINIKTDHRLNNTSYINVQ